MKKKLKKGRKRISSLKESVNPKSYAEVLRAIPKTLYIIVIILFTVGVLSTSYGIYSFINDKSSAEITTLDIKGEVVSVNDKDKNITVKYVFNDTTYTVILDHYEEGMKTGDSVDLKVNPNDVSGVFIGKAPIITVVGISVTLSVICIALHTVFTVKRYGSPPTVTNSAWIVCASLAFLSCGLGVTSSLGGKTKLGITLAVVGGAVFTVTAWILYISGSNKTRKKYIKQYNKARSR